MSAPPFTTESDGQTAPLFLFIATSAGWPGSPVNDRRTGRQKAGFIPDSDLKCS